jgi:hypothetical protein
MVQREGERGRRKRGGARAPRRTGFFFPPRWALPFSVRAFPSVLTPPPDEESTLLYGGGPGRRSILVAVAAPRVGRQLLVHRRSAPQLCWGLGLPLVVAVLSYPGSAAVFPASTLVCPVGYWLGCWIDVEAPEKAKGHTSLIFSVNVSEIIMGISLAKKNLQLLV